MIPITSSAACELWYSLCSRTTCPWCTIASGSPTHGVMDSITWVSEGSGVATDRQIETPPSLSLVASTAMPCPWTCPTIVMTLPGTLTVQSQCWSEKPGSMWYSESLHWSMSSHTGRRRFTDSHDGRTVNVTFTYTVTDVVEWFIKSTSRFQESYQRTRYP